MLQQELIIQTTGPHIHVEQGGAGSPTVLLIHGGGDGAFAWDLFAPAVARHFTTLVMDLRGHGDSGWDESGRYRVDDFVSDVAHVIEHTTLGPLILIGHSIGAAVAIHLRALYAERVVASVLVDFAPELNPEGIARATEFLKQSFVIYPTVNAYARWLEDTRVLADAGLLEQIASRSLRRDDDGFRLKVDPAIADAFPNLVPPESRQRLWSLLQQQSCPTLLVRGAGSAILSPATARRVVSGLPLGELAIVEAAGHSVMLDNPVAFERTVLAYLQKVLGARRSNSTSHSA